MKRGFVFPMLILVLMGTGCSRYQYIERKGSICIPSVATADFSTSDPIDIKQDVVDKTAKLLHKKVVSNINGINLKHTKDCAQADFELKLNILRLDSHTETTPRRGWVTTWQETRRIYSISVAGNIVNHKTKDDLPLSLNWSEERENIDYTIESLATSIMYDVNGSYVKK